MPPGPRPLPPRRRARPGQDARRCRPSPTSIGGTFARLQFTPDLVPADIVGTRIWRPSREAFDIEWGPVFANFVLADEINRAPAKVQSALLEVMAERPRVDRRRRPRRCPSRSSCWPPRTRSSPRASTRCPRRSATASSCRSSWTTRSYAEETEIARRMGVQPADGRAGADDRAAARACRPWPTTCSCTTPCADYAVRLVHGHPRPGGLGRARLAAAPRPWAPARAPRSAWSPPAGPWPCCAAAATSLPQDVFDVAPEVLRHRLILSYDALAEASPPTTSSGSLLRTVTAPRVVAPAGHGGHADRRPRRCRRACRHDRRDIAPRRRAAAGRRAAPARAPRHAGASTACCSGDFLGLGPGPGTEPGGARPYDAGRRRPPHRLEPHRPLARAPGAHHRRRPRAGDLDRRRPLGQPRLRHRACRRSATWPSPPPPPSGS